MSKSTQNEFIQIKFQSGPIHDVGINGCRIEDVIDLLTDKLSKFQSGELACHENEMAIKHLALARQALVQRRKLRQQQGVFDTHEPHNSLFDYRTEDVDANFSATGA